MKQRNNYDYKKKLGVIKWKMTQHSCYFPLFNKQLPLVDVLRCVNIKKKDPEKKTLEKCSLNYSKNAKSCDANKTSRQPQFCNLTIYIQYKCAVFAWQLVCHLCNWLTKCNRLFRHSFRHSFGRSKMEMSVAKLCLFCPVFCSLPLTQFLWDDEATTEKCVAACACLFDCFYVASAISKRFFDRDFVGFAKFLMQLTPNPFWSGRF